MVSDRLGCCDLAFDFRPVRPPLCLEKSRVQPVLEMDSFDFGDRPYRVFDVEHVVRDRLGVENDCGGQLHYVMPAKCPVSRFA